MVRRSYQSSGGDQASPFNRRHTRRADSSWGCSCVQVIHDAEDPSAVPSGRDLPAGKRRHQTHFPTRSAGRVGQTSIVHTMIISAVIRAVLRRQPS
jgi:hypothetical protein